VNRQAEYLLDSGGGIALLADMPATRTVVEQVLADWPDHEKYLQKSLGLRTSEQLQTTETLAAAALVLAGDRLEELAANYRWTCDRLRDEELYFHRHGAYRLSTFEEADREVYSNADYMEKYVDGLLLSQVLWFNHVASCDFFMRRSAELIRSDGRYLEVGPGHGLMTYLTLRQLRPTSAVAWDLSAVSIEHTRKALEKLGVFDVTCEVRDVMAVEPGEGEFDFVVLSEVLEHIEDPMPVMARLRSLLSPQGIIFINVPINSPSPDHIYLMETVEDAQRLLTENGFAIIDEAHFATQGTKLERALKNKVSVSINMFAQPA